MKTTTLLIPALLLFGGAAWLPVAQAHSFRLMQDVQDDTAALESEYATAVEQWQDAIENATKEERKVLRKTKPAVAFWPRFEKLAKAGHGRALLWMVEHLRDAGIKSSERADVLSPIYKSLANDHCNAEWFGDVFSRLSRDTRILGDEAALELYETILAKTESDEHRAGALYNAGQLLEKSDNDVAKKTGAAYLARVEAEFPLTVWGMKMRATQATEAVQIGKPAPDFTGETIDDFEFNLSDYKGKVVLLDFYGFW